MSTTPNDPRALRQSVSALDRHSPLYRWLSANHDDLTDALDGRPILWRAFCAWVAELGLVDAKGNPPSERTARETWYRVRQAVARRAAASPGGGRAGMPSRAPADWQPPLASPAPSRSVPPVGAETSGPPASAPTAGAAPLDMSAKAQIERVKARLGRHRY